MYGKMLYLDFMHALHSNLTIIATQPKIGIIAIKLEAHSAHIRRLGVAQKAAYDINI